MVAQKDNIVTSRIVCLKLITIVFILEKTIL